MARRRFDTLDSLRGIAAILVMIYHYYQYRDWPLLKSTFIAVDFFFILSGFVIMHAYGARLAAGMPKSLYIAHRVIRLYPLMALGILLGVPGLYAYTSLGHTDYFNREIFASALSNLCFIPYLNGKSVFNTGGSATTGILFPADDPLWSVFFELLASIGFIVLYRLSTPRLLKIYLASLTLLVAGAILNAFASYSPDLAIGNGWSTFNFLGGVPRVFYSFTAGILLYTLRDKMLPYAHLFLRLPLALKTVSIYGLGILCLVCPCVGHGSFYLLAITVLAPLVILGGSELVHQGWFSRLERFLGWLSYPLYCLHKPVLIGFLALDEKFGVKAHTGFSPEIVGMAVTLFLSVGAGLADQSLRRHLTRWYDRHRQQPAVPVETNPTALRSQPC